MRSVQNHFLPDQNDLLTKMPPDETVSIQPTLVMYLLLLPVMNPFIKRERLVETAITFFFWVLTSQGLLDLILFLFCQSFPSSWITILYLSLITITVLFCMSITYRYISVPNICLFLTIIVRHFCTVLFYVHTCQTTSLCVHISAVFRIIFCTITITFWKEDMKILQSE